MSHDSLGDRIKSYEETNRRFLLKRSPVIIRIDGKAFHSYTKDFKRPFDDSLIQGMLSSAISTAKEMQGFKIGYVQSDEVSFLLLDTDSITTEPWFNNNSNKIISISSSLMTGFFNSLKLRERIAFFDSRAFNVPESDIANYFLWRAKDWERNSLQMYARSFFSQKQLEKKKKADMHEMLYSIGKNWTEDLSDQIKNGSWFFNSKEGIKTKFDLKPNFEEINLFIEKICNKN